MTLRLRLLLAIAAFGFLAISDAHAQGFFWDPDGDNTNNNGSIGSGLGGTGNWDTTSSFWWPGTGGNGTWSNLANNTAIFWGTAGTVTLTENINVGGLTFNTTGYTITTGANTLSFGGTNNPILFGAVATATITGNIAGAGNVSLSTSNVSVTGNLTFNGATNGGWSGSTTINAGMTLTSTSSGTTTNLLLKNTSAITLNGGSLVVNRQFIAVGEDYISNSAAITVNGGGTLNIASLTAGSVDLNETIHSVAVNSGQFFLSPGNGSSGSNVTVANGITVNGTSSIGYFTGGNLTTTNRIFVTGAGTTTGWVGTALSNPVIGPWATTGGTAATQADYAVFSAGQIVPANTGFSGESTWNDPALQFTANAGLGGLTLTGTRNVAALRSISVNNTGTAINGNPDFTLTGHTYAVNDAVVISSAQPTGFTAGVTYFVVATGTNTFQLSATLGGSAITPTSSTSPTISAALLLSSGKNLGTTGLLAGTTTTLNISNDGTGGVVTLPTTTSANLYLNTGSGTIRINAPIADNGTGVLTLVKTGTAGSLILNGANTFTGPLVINSGTVTLGNNGAWGPTGKSVTFGGSGTLTSTSAYVNAGTLSVQQGAVATITPASITFASTTGSGTIVFSSGVNTGLLNLGDASTFTGNVQFRLSGNANYNGATAIQFSVLNDAAGSVLQFLGGTSDSNQGLSITLAGDVGPLTFNNRRVQIMNRIFPSNWEIRDNILANNNTNTANIWVINTPLDYFGGNQTTSPVGPQSGRVLGLGGSNAGNNEFAGVISNGRSPVGIGLTKSGTGKWIVSATNTYTGATTISGGVLQLATAAALPGGTASTGGISLLILNGGVLGLGAGNFTRGIGSTPADFQFTSSGGGFAAYGANRTVSPGTLNWGTTVGTNIVGTLFLSAADSDATITWTSSISLAGSNRTINVANGSATTDAAISGTILSGAGQLSKTGAGTLRLSNTANVYPGNTSIAAGVLEVVKLSDGTVSSSIGVSSNAATSLLIGSGTTLRYVGSGDSTDRNFTLNGTAAGNNGILDASGTGPIIFTNTTTPAYGTNNQTRFLQLIGTNTGANTLTANIANNGSGAVSLTKNGIGTWVLAGSNVYTGATAVNAGTLRVNGATAAASTVNVAAAGTLGGTGTVGGQVVLNGTIAPGANTGTLTTGSNTWNAAARYTFEINDFAGTAGSTTAGWDLLTSTGALTINATSPGNQFVIALTSLTSSQVAGPASNFNTASNYTITIATFAGGVTGFEAGGANFTVDTSAFANAFDGTWTVENAGNSINLVFTTAIPEPSLALIVLGAFGVIRRRK